jgi:hypothetical protein
MRVELGNKYNVFTSTLNVTAKTLTINNVIGFDIESSTLQSVYDSTTTSYFTLGKNIISFTEALIAGLPVWTITFGVLPAGSANTDTLIILMNVPDSQATYSLLSYSASKV